MAKQPMLPELQDDLIEGIQQCAADLHEVRLRKQNLTRVEAELTEKLLAAMHEAELQTYHHGGVIVTVERKERPKVEVRPDEVDS